MVRDGCLDMLDNDIFFIPKPICDFQKEMATGLLENGVQW